MVAVNRASILVCRHVAETEQPKTLRHIYQTKKGSSEELPFLS